MMEGKYVVESYGAYLSDIFKDEDGYHVGWTYLSSCAMLFDTYSKAYSRMRKVNTIYRSDTKSYVRKVA